MITGTNPPSRWICTPGKRTGRSTAASLTDCGRAMLPFAGLLSRSAG